MMPGRIQDVFRAVAGAPDYPLACGPRGLDRGLRYRTFNRRRRSGESLMTKAHRVSRRTALKLGAASAALPLVHIRTGRAAGKVSVAFWDHWVPEGNEVMKKQCAAFAAKNQVEVQADFIT